MPNIPPCGPERDRAVAEMLGFPKPGAFGCYCTVVALRICRQAVDTDAGQSHRPDADGGRVMQLLLCFTADTPKGTRAAARGGVETVASLHRSRLMALFDDGLELTADEAGQRIGLSPLQVRPRISELAKTYGRIEPSGDRRPSHEGNPSTVWRKRANGCL